MYLQLSDLDSAFGPKSDLTTLESSTSPPLDSFFGQRGTESM